MYLSCIQFADDTTLYYTHKNLRVSRACINHDLTKLFDWFRANSLTLNISKTNLLLFNHQKTKCTMLEIHIDGKTIKSVNSTKFLGIILDDKLSWKNHYDHLKSKINQNYALLCKSKKSLNVHGMKVLHYAQIYSHLSYCIVLWCNMLSVELSRKLQVLQNKCVKLLNLNKTTDYSYKNYGILKLEDMIDLEQKKLGYKLKHGVLPPNLEKLMLTDRIGASLKKQHH